MKELTAELKAKQLVNMYYAHSKTQNEAIQIVDGVLLRTLCQKIDSLHDHIFNRKDFDDALIKSQIQELKRWHEVCCEVSKLVK